MKEPKHKSETVTLSFDVEIHYCRDEAREAAIEEASRYFKCVTSSQGYWINSNIRANNVCSPS